MSDNKVRNDYIKAANRHLCVCIELKKIIQKFEDDEKNKRALNRGETFLKDQLLCDLYYLTGYVIECSCSAAIFHHFPKVSKKKDLNDDNKKIRFKKTKKGYFVVASGNHSLVHFRNAFSQNHLNQSIEIPLLNGSPKVFQNNNCEGLYYKYEAEIRYSKVADVNIHLDYTNCFGFLNAAIIIYNETVKKFKLDKIVKICKS